MRKIVFLTALTGMFLTGTAFADTGYKYVPTYDSIETDFSTIDVTVTPEEEYNSPAYDLIRYNLPWIATGNLDSKNIQYVFFNAYPSRFNVNAIKSRFLKNDCENAKVQKEKKCDYQTRWIPIYPTGGKANATIDAGGVDLVEKIMTGRTMKPYETIWGVKIPVWGSGDAYNKNVVNPLDYVDFLNSVNLPTAEGLIPVAVYEGVNNGKPFGASNYFYDVICKSGNCPSSNVTYNYITNNTTVNLNSKITNVNANVKGIEFVTNVIPKNYPSNKGLPFAFADVPVFEKGNGIAGNAILNIYAAIDEEGNRWVGVRVRDQIDGLVFWFDARAVKLLK